MEVEKKRSWKWLKLCPCCDLLHFHNICSFSQRRKSNEICFDSFECAYKWGNKLLINDVMEHYSLDFLKDFNGMSKSGNKNAREKETSDALKAFNFQGKNRISLHSIKISWIVCYVRFVHKNFVKDKLAYSHRGSTTVEQS